MFFVASIPQADSFRNRYFQIHAFLLWIRRTTIPPSIRKRKQSSGWMNTPRDIFWGRTLEDLVATGNEDAQRRVLKILLRIDYGVSSQSQMTVHRCTAPHAKRQSEEGNYQIASLQAS
jgi:hypothetical protein